MIEIFSKPNLSKTSTILITFSLIWIGISTQVKIDPSTSSNSAPHAGFSAPSFTLPTLSGEEISLSDYEGQAILVNLWASWCGPCREEMPAMQRIYDLYKDDGFVILAINVTNQDNLANASQFVDEFNLSFPILLDLDGSVSDKYRLQALPSSFFIDQSGVIQEVVIGGPMAEALLQTRVESLLEGK